MKRAVVLLSGGLDSTTTLATAIAEGYETYALSFDYGQRHKIEIDATRRIARALGAKEHRVASGNVRDRNTVPDFCCRSFLWHINAVCERRATEDSHVDLRYTMLFCAKCSCDSARGVDLDLVSLAVIE